MGSGCEVGCSLCECVRACDRHFIWKLCWLESENKEKNMRLTQATAMTTTAHGWVKITARCCNCLAVICYGKDIEMVFECSPKPTWEHGKKWIERASVRERVTDFKFFTMHICQCVMCSVWCVVCVCVCMCILPHLDATELLYGSPCVMTTLFPFAK